MQLYKLNIMKSPPLSRIKTTYTTISEQILFSDKTRNLLLLILNSFKNFFNYEFNFDSTTSKHCWDIYLLFSNSIFSY